MANDDIQNLLKAGITAAKGGNKIAARKLLEKALEQDDGNETAWMWYATVVETPREKRICLENVLEINPQNQRAKEALEKLGPAEAASAAPAETLSEAFSANIFGAAPAMPREAKPIPPSPSSSPRPAPQNINREAPVRRRRRIFSPLFLAGGFAGLMLILLGVYLLLTSTGDNSAPPIVEAPVVGQTQTPAGNGAAVAVAPTVKPAGTVETAVPATPKSLPTITPSPTNTPGTPVPPTATLPPVTAYKLYFNGDGRSGQSKTAIFQINGDGSGEQKIVSGDTPVTDVAVSSDNRIAYVGVVDNVPQLFVAGVDGKNAAAITKLTGKYVGTPSWSRDNRFIAFVSDEPGHKEIYSIDADGKNQKRLTNGKFDSVDPAWSPKGDQIAYAADQNGKKVYQIMVLTVSNNKAVQLTNANGSSYQPAWSPDGSFIAFVSTRDRFEDIYISDARDGTRTTLLTFNDGEASNHNPDWSPDGRYIAFVSNRKSSDGKTFGIYLITPDAKVLLPVNAGKDAKANSFGVHFAPGQ